MGAVDVLDEAAAELIQAGLDAERVQGVLRQVRARWSGCEVYIRQREPATEVEIRRALESGQPLREVARRAGVSERTIRRRRSMWFD